MNEQKLKEAVELYAMHDIDLIHLISEINSYYGGYDEYVFYDMDEFNDIYCNVPPLEIVNAAVDAYGDFDIVDDFMNMRNCEPVANCDGDLWDIITADDDALFDDKGYEILK